MNPNLTDVDQFRLMMHRKRSVVRISLYIGMPLLCIMAINNFIKGDHFAALLNCAMLLILVLLGFVIKGSIDEKFEYKTYSILFRLFNAWVGIALLYEIGFQSNFSRIEWCYIYPILVFFVVGIMEGVIWVSIFYAILVFFILSFDLQEITPFQIQELRSRFLVSFSVVCMLSLFLEHGFHHAWRRLINHQHILKESENRYRQAYEKLNIEIQERKRAEEALRQSEEKYRTILENIEDGYYEVDLAGNLTFFNDSMCRIWGYAKEELMGMNDRQYTDQENAKKLFQAFNKVYRTGEPRRECDWEIIRKDRTKRCIEASVSLQKDLSSKPIGFRGIIRDITERKQAEKFLQKAHDELEQRVKERTVELVTTNEQLKHEIEDRKLVEEALRESEEKYRTILENIEEGYYKVDLAGHLTFFNDSLCRMLGYPGDELIGMNDRQFTDQANSGRLYQAFNKVYKTGEPSRAFDWELIRKDGARRFCEVSVSLIQDLRGQPGGFRGIARDITEQKRAQEALQKAHDELEMRVCERTKEIAEINEALKAEIAERKRTEEALRERTEELGRSNGDLEQFAYVASHDLQEPLRMVTSYVQLLAKRYKGKLDSDADEFIGFAVDGATRMWKLINDLLTYSRAGMREKELEPTDCEKVLNHSLNNLKLAIEEKGAVVTHGPLPTVMADKPQLGQLFQNLIGNAIKFRGNEPPRVYVSASRDGNVWTFSVRDNGMGIAPEYAKRIFIIFQRLHSRQGYPGTGIGLAICKKIVERHGGRIWVESEVGKGATFYFTLPVSKAEPLPYSVSKEARAEIHG